MKWLALLVLLAACDATRERAQDHLSGLGFKAVACAAEGGGTALCSADDTRFRCVVADRGGCMPSAVACERLAIDRVFVERPAQ